MINDKLTEIEELLLELIRIPSFSGKEKEIADFIVEKLEGFEIERQFVGEDRFNIVAVKGESKKWLVAHMDTVPGDLPVKITDDAIFGRGACDNKQSVAASIIVGKKMRDVNLLFTVGEEGHFEGAIAAQKAGIKGDLIIVQEPTDFKIVTGQRGLIVFRIITKGVAKHSGLGNLDSANDKIVDILFSLKSNKWTSFNMGIVKGGSAKGSLFEGDSSEGSDNVVADRGESLISVRPDNIEEYHSILAGIQNIAGEIVIMSCFEPHISSLQKFPLEMIGVFTEMSFFENAIIYGAGDIDLAHSENEHISRKDLNALPGKLIELLNLDI